MFFEYVGGKDFEFFFVMIPVKEDDRAVKKKISAFLIVRFWLMLLNKILDLKGVKDSALYLSEKFPSLQE